MVCVCRAGGRKDSFYGKHQDKNVCASCAECSAPGIQGGRRCTVVLPSLDDMGVWIEDYKERPESYLRPLIYFIKATRYTVNI